MCVMYTCTECVCTYSCIYTCIYLYRHNHLNPDISKEAWTHEEDLKLVEAHLVIQVFLILFFVLLKLVEAHLFIYIQSCELYILYNGFVSVGLRA
jgi:hypothetical protein